MTSMSTDSIMIDNKKVSRKWVKRANAWCKIVEEVGSKDSKGKVKMKTTWHQETPDLTID